MSGAAAIKIKDEDRFEIGGVAFRVIRSDYFAHKTTPEEMVILKPAHFMASYDPIFSAAPSKNVVEFGIFEGGSIIGLALLHPDFRFVGIDKRKSDQAVLDHIVTLGLQDRVKLYYGIDQGDRTAVQAIIEGEFGSEPLGIVIDDASHQYELSKRTFETTFPRVAEDGVYCLEDWAWAHWPAWQDGLWGDAPALTNLVFELTMLMPSRGGIIKRMVLSNGMAQIVRGPLRKEVDIDSSIVARGRKISLI